MISVNEKDDKGNNKNINPDNGHTFNTFQDVNAAVQASSQLGNVSHLLYSAGKFFVSPTNVYFSVTQVRSRSQTFNLALPEP